MLLYADDLKIYLVVTREDCIQLQEPLDTLIEWCRLNRLVVSVAKCLVITFHRLKCPIAFDYCVDGNVLERVDQVSDLGVVLDAKLTLLFGTNSALSITT